MRQGIQQGALPSLCFHPHLEDRAMAHIRDTLAPHFTGHVGPLRFVDGHAETADPELVAYFLNQPDRYDVAVPFDAETPAPTPQPTPQPEPDPTPED